MTSEERNDVATSHIDRTLAIRITQLREEFHERNWPTSDSTVANIRDTLDALLDILLDGTHEP